MEVAARNITDAGRRWWLWPPRRQAGRSREGIIDLPFFIDLALALALWFALFLLDRPIRHLFHLETPRDRAERELRDEIEELRQQQAGSEASHQEQIGLLHSRNEFLLDQLQRASWEIVTLRRNQEHRMSAEQPDRQAPGQTVVLGIWPTVSPPLNTGAERRAIYNAGFDYLALNGEAATRAGVVREVERIRPQIIEIGSHGSAAGLELTDGTAGPGWWSRLAQRYQIDLFVLLACHSDDQRSLSVADALINAGVAAVVAVSEQIADRDAIAFSDLLYERLAAHDTLQEAVSRARLVVSDEGAEMIRLRVQRRESQRLDGRPA